MELDLLIHNLQCALCVVPECAVDFGVDGVVGVADAMDAIVGLGQNGGQGGEAWSLWPVEHLGLEPGKFVLQIGKFFGQSFNNAGVNAADDAIIGSPQVL